MKISIESGWLDYRKHGRAFIRRMSSKLFIEPQHIEWSKKCMKAWFSFDADEGELLQVRLQDGSWKNDSRGYVRVAPNGELVTVSQAEAGRAIAMMNSESQDN